jgi:hypothetical protein
MDSGLASASLRRPGMTALEMTALDVPITAEPACAHAFFAPDYWQTSDDYIDRRLTIGKLSGVS